MKKLMSYLFLLSVAILFSSSVTIGQHSGPPYRNSTSFNPKHQIQSKLPSTNSGKDFNHLRLKEKSTRDVKATSGNIDTLNYPLAGTYTYYISEEGGYVTGNNEYGDVAKANYFETNEALTITGLLFDFAKAVGGNPSIQFAIWDKSGGNNYPGNTVGTTSVDLNVIKNDVSNNQLTFIPFNPPVTVTTSFYAGVMLPATAGDTLAIWSNTHGDTNPGIAWEKWNDNNWYPISSNDSWGLNIAMAIFAIVDDEVPLTALFSANNTNIQAGQSVTFIDLSPGGPTGWEWTFEGGNPATSSLQNPVVTYNLEGSYDVTLTVWKDAISDSKTISNFINVGGSQIEIDTLNYPLAGEYGVYITDANGFVTGNNEFGDLAKANYFPNNQTRYVTGLLLEFAYATGGNPNIEIAIWDNSGTNGKPGSKIGSNSLFLNTIKNHIINNQFSFVAFDPPVNVSQPFYAGFMLPTTTGDTLVVWSNTDGDTSPSTAWELWNDNQWYGFTGNNTWNLDIALAIYPIVQNTLGVNEFQANPVIHVFPNPTNGRISITTDKYKDQPFNLVVYNSRGAIIQKTSGNNTDLISIDIGEEQPGIYMVKLNLGPEVFTQKIIKL